MQKLVQIQAGDREFLAAIDAATTEAVRRSGEWLACRPGCTECCLGPFAITQLDALRLRQGLGALDVADPAQAERVRTRAAAYIAAITPDYPGDPDTGELRDEDDLPSSMEDAPCPALDPSTGLCDLYVARPVTCRVFGPATRTGEGSIGHCELCYAGATDAQKVECAVDVDPEGLEGKLLDSLEAGGLSGATIVAYTLAGVDAREEPRE